MIDNEIRRAADALLERCRARKLKIATAESCTGGLLAGALTAIAGSSEVFDRGFVTYSNRAKNDLLDVAADQLKKHGAVSRLVAESMARGALAHSDADIVVGITGIAGPGGGAPGKPVGLVHFSVASRTGALVHEEVRFGDLGRDEVRRRSVLKALSMLTSLVERG